MRARGLTCVLVCGAFVALARGAAADERQILFDRDIQPILSDRCLECHGPDPRTRKARLRLDTRGGAFAPRKGRAVLVPGRPAESELFRRISATDRDERMPPIESGKELDRGEVELIRRWIQQGAPWRGHWAFTAPARIEPPRVRSSSWVRGPIDHFVLARLETERLEPSREADRSVLIRRVTLDLTGLPPTPEEIDAFLADSSPTAYERVVDRLLSSPRYGERMAVAWLDAARYSDTHGYLFDTQRDMWRWREWVIDAYNSGMPFDQFTVEQLAGDLLPAPTLSQRIATGFNRNHIINNEAGAIPAEYLVENIVDRVATTSTVWLGLTLGCARCHDHKYDPISQKEFYQLYAFFDRVPELGLDGLNANAVPWIKAPTPLQAARLAELRRQSEAAEKALEELAPRIDRDEADWERSFARPPEPVTEGLVAYWPLDRKTDDLAVGSSGASGDVGGATFQGGPATYESGMMGGAASLDGLRYLDAGDRGRFERTDAFSLAAWVFPVEKKGRRAVFSRMLGADQGFRGYALQLVAGIPAFYLIHRFPDNLVNVQAKSPLEMNRWHHLLVTYDGSGKAEGVRLVVDGDVQKVQRLGDTLTSAISNSAPLYLGKGHPGAMLKGRIDEVRIYDRVLAVDEARELPGLSIHSLIAVDRSKRNPGQSRRIREHYLKHHAPPRWRERYEKVQELTDRIRDLEKELPTVMVMKEREGPRRETRMLVRGAYDRPGEKVEPGTPAILPSMAADLPRNRLGLARWLVDPAHPLTARVAVNRYWQMHFGTGLVKTTEDFGTRGERPSHPELLDWLATELVRSEWDVKAMHRLIVTSATYRQSSRVTPELLDRDPENRLLARGPRFRLGAEVIRDQALAISGLLVGTIGGPSVKPYQPEGLWRQVAFDTSGANLTAQVYEPGKGEDLYRRSLYTFWKRTSPPPTMAIFDAPDRERCVVRRAATNTPRQALVVMNGPTFVEASRKLAERMMKEGSTLEAVAGSGARPIAGPAGRIELGFRLATGRWPTDEETALLVDVFRGQLDTYRESPETATALLAVGASPRDASLDVPGLAAYAVIANLLLNLDETLTRS